MLSKHIHIGYRQVCNVLVLHESGPITCIEYNKGPSLYSPKPQLVLAGSPQVEEGNLGIKKLCSSRIIKLPFLHHLFSSASSEKFEQVPLGTPCTHESLNRTLQNRQGLCQGKFFILSWTTCITHYELDLDTKKTNDFVFINVTGNHNLFGLGSKTNLKIKKNNKKIIIFENVSPFLHWKHHIHIDLVRLWQGNDSKVSTHLLLLPPLPFCYWKCRVPRGPRRHQASHLISHL